MYSDLDLLHRPTLASTLRQMGSVSLSIWRDYRHFTRLARRQRRLARTFSLSPTKWQEDHCHVAVVVFIVIGMFATGVHLAGAWVPLLALLGVA